MKKMKEFAVLLALMAAAGVRAEMGTGTITSSTTEIYGGMVYTVQDNVTIPGANGRSALTVRSGGDGDGKRVVIDIPEGCSLTVTGRDADGRNGAGAGILLPSDMTLYITGKGTLTATGGKAANGGNGSNGGDAEFNDSGTNHFKNGGGGDGGEGGGGADGPLGAPRRNHVGFRRGRRYHAIGIALQGYGGFLAASQADVPGRNDSEPGHADADSDGGYVHQPCR